MATYFESKNDNGKVVVNDTTRMLSLLRCGHVSELASRVDATNFNWNGAGVSNDRGAGSAAIYRLTLADDEKLVAFSALDNENIAVCTSQLSPSLIDIIIFRTRTISDDIASIASKIRLYVFGEDYSANNSCGIQLFNENGELIFKNTDYMMNIKGVWNISVNMFRKNCNSLPATYLITDNANNIAVVCSAYAGNWVMSPYNDIPPWCGVYAISRKGTALYAKLIVMFWFNNCYRYYNGLNNQSSALLIDITNAPM